jgi:hypothetical protein
MRATAVLLGMDLHDGQIRAKQLNVVVNPEAILEEGTGTSWVPASVRIPVTSGGVANQNGPLFGESDQLVAIDHPVAFSGSEQ